MHVTQQLQYEEIQQLTHAIPTPTESNTKALKERLDAPAYFDASDLFLLPTADRPICLLVRLAGGTMNFTFDPIWSDLIHFLT
ncbi:hypothetical protein BDBG_05842 [Blastomyces gilchristii SLH14081]|uniref:Uncharacterized protein n=1 Tax=Blastomyces gilchristii (strain SLH14081) TaxID=559298 RepID=A0A179USF2_BLAGS|nr:uncharacterized protein BDBG_05842 [Blastomyces gilchristii SLH14081]OAT10169.1 hypothetical protein BDBG_05842 [Blastomyces gilchristii SLH14081]